MDTQEEITRETFRAKFNKNEWYENHYDDGIDKLFEFLEPIGYSLKNIISEVAYTYQVQEQDLIDEAIDYLRESAND